MFDILLQIDTTKVATELLSQKSESCVGRTGQRWYVDDPFVILIGNGYFLFY